jgi:hypothetical protein
MDFFPDMLTNFKFSLKSLLFAIIIASLITSCTTTKTEKKIEKKTIAGQSDDLTRITSKDYLNRAKSLPASKSIPMLVSASEQLLFEGKLHQAIWLANQTCVLVTAEFTQGINQKFCQGLNPSSAINNIIDNAKLALLYRIISVKAGALGQLGYYSLAKKQLIVIESIHDEYAMAYPISYYQLIKLIATDQSLTLKVINAQLRILSVQADITDDDAFLLWQSLSQLSSWQIKQLIIMNPPNFKGWQTLLSIAHRLGSQRQQFNQALDRWQQLNNTHLANIIIPTLRKNSETLGSNISNIAVLLPLSGNQKIAGFTAQQGILAAYQENTDRKLHFIDENNIDMTTLNKKFTEYNIDFVIGPLLKNHVDEYLDQKELMIPTLLLNLPESAALRPHQVALSMRREDEAMQAAANLSQKNYKHPLVIASKSNISHRIAESFTTQWQKIRGDVPEIIYVEAGAKMQVDLKSSLEVTNSEQRIKNIKRHFNQKVKSELRNRRDIDMIYLVANPAQTKLLKPYIDVNTSPFSSVIPVFASSLSHSINDDKSDNRDLTGLIFTEIPWLLLSKQQNKSLAHLSNDLWPQRTDSLERIFAMGYDSLLLANKIPLMQQSNYIRHYGQTGILKLDYDNILTRSLIWGQYRKNQVKQVRMD